MQCVCFDLCFVSGATFAVNQYAAMTPEEFKQHVLMPPRKPVRFPEERLVCEMNKIDYCHRVLHDLLPIIQLDCYFTKGDAHVASSALNLKNTWVFGKLLIFTRRMKVTIET